jgi:hypothetical protein
MSRTRYSQVIVENLSFLNWFRKNQYRTPKELEFRNEKGNLHWLHEEKMANQPIENDKIVQREKRDVDRDSSKQNISELVKILLKKIRPEIDQYYEWLKLHVRKKGRTALHICYQDALEVFKSVETKFEMVNKEDIHEKLFGSDKPYRDIKGGIMRNIVLRTYPEAKSHTSDINLSAQALYNLSNDLKKS